MLRDKWTFLFTVDQVLFAIRNELTRLEDKQVDKEWHEPIELTLNRRKIESLKAYHALLSDQANNGGALELDIEDVRYFGLHRTMEVNDE